MVTWNINILCGPDWNTPVQAADVAELLLQFDADVIVLQEAPCEGLDEKWDARLREPLERMRALDAILKENDYTLLRSCADNATLLATRLSVLATEGFTLDLEGPTATRNGSEVWTESRGARYAMLAPPGELGPPLAVYATHLSHKDATLVMPSTTKAREPVAEAAAAATLPPMRNKLSSWEGATEVGGVRKRQATALLDHMDTQHLKDMTVVVLADFNAPIPSHYSEAEWKVIAAGLTSKAVAQPLDDGVRDLLLSRGFQCAYDQCPPSQKNFGGRIAPPMTHWTGTVVDFVYVASTAWRVGGVYVKNTPLSDHLPVVVDLLRSDAFR